MDNIFYAFLLVILAGMFLFKLRIRKNESYDVLSRDTTDVLKGYSIALIIIHHMVLRMSNPGILLPFRLVGYLGVSVFFLTSGYGLVCSSMNREKDYSHGFMQKRFFKIYIPAVIAQLIYMLVLVFMFDKDYSCVDFLKGLFILYPVDTSQWYIISAFYWYFAFWIFLKFFKSWKNTIIGLFILSAVYITAGMILGATKNWIDTALCFPIGVSLGVYKEKIFGIINKYIKFIFIPAGLFAITVFFSYGKDDVKALVLRMVSSVMFLICVLALLRFVDISKNKIMKIIGIFSLECYLVHGKVIRIIKLGFGDVGVLEMLLYIVSTAFFVFVFVMFLKKYNYVINKLEKRK